MRSSKLTFFIASSLLFAGCSGWNPFLLELTFLCSVDAADVEVFIDGPREVAAGEPVTYNADGSGKPHINEHRTVDCPVMLRWHVGGDDQPRKVVMRPKTKQVAAGIAPAYCAIDNETLAVTFPAPPRGKESYKTSVSLFLGDQESSSLGAKKIDVTVRDPDFTPLPEPKFESPQTYTQAENPTAVAAGSSGGPFVAVTDDRPGSAVDRVLIYKTIANKTTGEVGLFTPAEVPLAAGKDPTDITTGDFNGDGELDLVVASAQTGNEPGFGDEVQVLLNSGDANALNPFSVTGPFTVAPNPRELATADFDGDGKLDIATASSGPGGPGDTGTVSVLRNDGGGTSFTEFPFDAAGVPVAIAAADFNADGHADIALTNPAEDQVVFLRNLGLATGSVDFDAPQPFGGVGRKPEGVDAGDIIGDGKADLALADTGTDSMTVLVNGTADGAEEIAISSRRPAATDTLDPKDAEIGDLNGDGVPDVATANNGSANASVFIGDGFGELLSARNFALGSGPRDLALGDLNGDGRDDLISANAASISVAMSDETGTAAAAASRGPRRPRSASSGPGSSFGWAAAFARAAKKKRSKNVTATGIARGMKLVNDGKLRFSKNGNTKIKGALLAGSLKLAPKGGKRAKRKLPAALRKVLKGRALGRVTITIFPEADPEVTPEFKISGIVATRSAKAGKKAKAAKKGSAKTRPLKACGQVRYDSRRKRKQSNSFKLVGGTGPLKRLRISGKAPKLTIHKRAKEKVKLQVQRKAKAKQPPKKCKRLLKKVGKSKPR